MGEGKFVISYVFADKPGEYNTSNWRCRIPAQALAKAGGYGVSLIPVQLFQENSKDAHEALEKSHIIVIERNFVGDVLTQMAFWKVRGKVIILNWDDAYHSIEETNVSYNYWHDGTIKMPDEKGQEQLIHIFPHPYDQFIWGLKMGYAATLPSKQLMEYYNQYIPTYYVPNYFEPQYYINMPKEERKNIIIGWGGSLSHLQSFVNSGVLKALQNICNLYSDVKILICGDQRVFDKIELPEDRKVFQPYVPYNLWGSIIAKNFDIGIAPLYGEYDWYRSNIKIVEYMMTQTPFVASDGPAYHEYSQYGTMIENSEENWTKALSDKINNLSKEKELVKGLPYQFALEQDVDKNVEKIADVYREIAKTHAKIGFS